MIFGQDRDELRRSYASAWAKAQAQQPLNALEQQIATVVGEHPEYQAIVAAQGTGIAPDSADVANAFLHLGLHLAIREQVATDRPAGLRDAFTALAHQSGDPHGAEHQCADVLARIMWDAQQAGTAPDEQSYLDGIRRLQKPAARR
ncbi:MAG: DUF1841 family protein [Pseudomonadota bacterium]